MKAMDVVTAILLIVGGVNWGAYGAMHFDLVATVLGDYSPMSRVVYALVGISAIYQAVAWAAIRSRWQTRTVAESH
ncbi:MAG TPA: DUF378 domain-containing protein [Acidobacteriaceae bacterium]|nr:DUF378 domain-containing protein [Acidobacteriaceae bacterium]